ncbi:MAG: four helix bundle protein [Desulfococcaceae bacterium]|jgi:hypothetical protein|nr:four helix bundle protein [Desulfococcaceae bacterium]
MARYEHLPIYKTAIDTAVYLQQIVRNFSRYDKYTIGTDLRNLSREILLLIIRANSVQDKTAVLKVLVENCEMLKTISEKNSGNRSQCCTGGGKRNSRQYL